jgi:hypothetical protein
LSSIQVRSSLLFPLVSIAIAASIIPNGRTIHVENSGTEGEGETGEGDGLGLSEVVVMD